MSFDLVKKVICKILEQKQEVVDFYWHGGEPLLLGCAFYEKVLEYQSKFNKSNIRITNFIQTNGLLLDDHLIEFFTKYDFNIGISIDGPPQINNSYRTIRNCSNTNLERHYRYTFDILKKVNAKYGIISVITPQSYNKAEEIFSYFLDMKIHSFAFLPLVIRTPDGHINAESSIKAENYGEFICRIFDIWLKNGDTSIAVREIDDCLRLIIGARPSLCYYKNSCDKYFTIMPNGYITFCDSLVNSNEYSMGNINCKLQEIYSSEKYQSFLKNCKSIDNDCVCCAYYKYCYGYCFATRDNKVSSRKKSYFCVAQKNIIDHIKKRIEGTDISSFIIKDPTLQ